MATQKVKKFIESELFSEIRRDLLDQLERSGTSGKYYLDLVDDYMDMWVTKCMLVEDIQLRGATIKFDNGGGQRGVKKNDSVDQRIKINAQMLKLLTELGIKPSRSESGDPGDDEEM